MLKKIFSVIIILFNCNLFATSDKIVLTVDSQPILESDIKHRVNFFKLTNGIDASSKAELMQLRNLAIDSLIDQTVTLNKAKQLDIKISDKQINESIKVIENRNNMASGDFKKLLADNHISWIAHKELIRSEIAFDQIASMLNSDIKITPSEVEDAILNAYSNNVMLELHKFVANNNSPKTNLLMMKLHNNSATCPINENEYKSFATREIVTSKLNELADELQKVIKHLSEGDKTPIFNSDDSIYFYQVCKRDFTQVNAEQRANIQNFVGGNKLNREIKKLKSRLKAAAVINYIE